MINELAKSLQTEGRRALGRFLLRSTETFLFTWALAVLGATGAYCYVAGSLPSPTIWLAMLGLGTIPAILAEHLFIMIMIVLGLARLPIVLMHMPAALSALGTSAGNGPKDILPQAVHNMLPKTAHSNLIPISMLAGLMLSALAIIFGQYFQPPSPGDEPERPT